MGSFEDRLQRLRSVDISKDGKADTRDSSPPSSPPPARSVPGGSKREISDKAANLIATALKDFLRD